jgi:hypothetical protein
LKAELENAGERIALSTASVCRKPQFRLDTSIWRRPNGIFLLKSAAGKEAESFLDVIERREQSATAFFKGNSSVVRGTREQEGLLYPFLPYPSFEKMVADRLASGDPHAALPIINNYLLLLRSLPTRFCPPEEFLRVVGDRRYRIDANVLCFSAGPIDLIPSNILVAENSCHVIDHEWFFDFPIPVDLVIYRGLTSMIFRLQREIRGIAAHSAVTLFSGYGTNRAYMPLTWAALLGKLELPLDTLNSWNSRFQQQVLLSSPAFHLRFNPHASGCICLRVSDGALPRTAPLLARWQFKGELAALKLKRVFQTMREKLQWKT